MSASYDTTYGFDTRDIPGTPKERKILARCQYLLKVGKQADKRFRKRAIEGVEFYFDDQWEANAKQTVEGRNQTAVTMNGIKPTVKIILGLMLAQPMDWVAKPVGGNDEAIADAANAALKFVAGRNHMPSVIQRVYFWGLTYGMCPVQVGPNVRTRDPRAEKCQVCVGDPREFRRDPQSVEPDGSDMRFVTWSRRVDVEDAKRQYPKGAFTGGQGGTDANLADGNNSGDGQDGISVYEGIPGVTPPPSLWDDYEDWNQFGEDADKTNKQVLLHTAWEVKDTPTWFYEGRDEQPIEFDPKDRAAILMTKAVVKAYKKDAPKVFKHVFCGPLLLESGMMDRKHNRIPVVFYDFERDQHGDPVSFVESLKQIQREVNRSEEHTSELQSRQYLV